MYRCEAASATVAALKSSIYELFNRIGCNTPAVRELLGDEGAVAEGSVLAYLGVIEQRTNELLQAFVLRRAADAHAPPAVAAAAAAAGGALPSPGVITEALVAQPLTSASPRIIIEPPSTTGMTPEEAELLAQEMAAASAAAAAAAAEAEGAGTAGLGGTGGTLPVTGLLDDEKPLTREALESRVARTLPRKLETAIRVRPPGSDAAGYGKRPSPNRR